MTDNQFLNAVSAMERIRELGAGLAVIGCGLLVFMALTSREAHADTWGVATLTSYHTDRAAHYNERNGGLGFETDIAAKDARLIGGLYRNSLYRESLYAGFTYTPFHLTDSVHLGGMAAAVTGYRTSPVALAAAILVQVEYERFGLNIAGIPRIEDKPGGVGIQVKFKF